MGTTEGNPRFAGGNVQGHAQAVNKRTTGHCAQCDRQVRVSEPFAFAGMDRMRATLACGHVVLREAAGL
jgi:hypothetical protein